MERLKKEISRYIYEKDIVYFNPPIFKFFRKGKIQSSNNSIMFVNEDPPFNSVAEIWEAIDYIVECVDNDIDKKFHPSEIFKMSSEKFENRNWIFNSVKIKIGYSKKNKLFLRIDNFTELLNGN